MLLRMQVRALSFVVVALAAVAARAEAPIKIEATLCKKLVGDKCFDVTAKFTRDAAALHGWWKSTDGREGMIVRTVWIAEDVGAAAPRNTKIDEKSVKLAAGILGKLATHWTGTLSLSRPNNGWPVGKYRAEIWFGGKLATTLHLTIE